MVERYQFIKLTSPHSAPRSRQALIEQIRQTLTAMPGPVAASVGAPADATAAAAWDLAIVLRFASLAAAEAFLQDPSYRAFVAEQLGGCVEVSKAWNFSIEGG
jgi:uncharacterized protein (DUF1330 family)